MYANFMGYNVSLLDNHFHHVFFYSGDDEREKKNIPCQAIIHHQSKRCDNFS